MKERMMRVVFVAMVIMAMAVGVEGQTQAAVGLGSDRHKAGGLESREISPIIFGISNRAAYDPIISTAHYFNFKVWGKVEILGSNSFTVDDGSGMPVTVLSSGFSGIQNGDYASAVGYFSGDGPSRVLNAQAFNIVKLQ